MPKPMLKQTQAQSQSSNIMSAVYQQNREQQTQQMDKIKLDRLLRKPRSKQYMDALQTLDVGGAYPQPKQDY